MSTLLGQALHPLPTASFLLGGALVCALPAEAWWPLKTFTALLGEGPYMVEQIEEHGHHDSGVTVHFPSQA